MSVINTSVSTVVVATTLQSLFQLSKSKSRCSTALQAIYEGRCLKPNQQDGSAGNSEGNLIIIGTCLVNNMIDRLRNAQSVNDATKSSDNERAQKQSMAACAIILAAISHSISTILFIDRTKLERIVTYSGKAVDNILDMDSPALTVVRAKMTSDSRIIIGRAFLSSVMGALAAIEVLCQDGHIESFKPFVRNALVSSFLALEMLTKLHVKSTTTPSFGTFVNCNLSGQSSKITADIGSSSVTPFHLTPLDMKLSNLWSDVVKETLWDSDIRFFSKEVPVWSGMISKEASSLQAMDDINLTKICTFVGDLLFGTNKEIQSLLVVLLTHCGILHPDSNLTPKTEQSSSPARKRTKRSTQKPAVAHATTSKSSEPSCLESAQYITKASAYLFGLSSNFDTKLPFRKWASSALVWFSDGQKRILKAAINLLHTDSFDNWQGVMMRRPIVGKALDSEAESAMAYASRSSSRKSDKQQTRKRKLLVEDTNRNDLIESSDLGIKGIHGKTALVAFVTKLVDLVCEIGRVGEVSDDAFQSYVNSLSLHTYGSFTSVKVSESEEQKTRGRRSKTSKAKDTPLTLQIKPLERFDIKDEVTMLIRYLLIAHNSCIRDTITSRNLIPMIGDETYFPFVDQGPIDYLWLYDDFISTDSLLYCPIIIEVISNLAICSSAASPDSESENTRKRLTAVGCSLATAYGQVFIKGDELVTTSPKDVIVVDARLLSMAMEFLSRSSDGIISDVENRGSESTTEKPPDDASVLDYMTDLYGLKRKLLPTIPMYTAFTDRKDKETIPVSSEAAEKGESVYAGVFQPSKSRLPWNGEIVSLFLRTFTTDDVSVSASVTKLLDAIHRAVAVCYSFKYQRTSSMNKANILAADCLNFIYNGFKTRELLREKNYISLGTDVTLLALISKVYLSTSSLSSFIRLGSRLHLYLHDRTETDEISPQVQRVALNDDAQYTSTIKKLWESHVQLSKAIGHAASSIIPDRTGDIDLDATEVLKLIALSSPNFTYQSHDDKASEAITSAVLWPLRLPSLYQALVLSYLETRLASGINYDGIAESFLCESITNSVEKVFEEMKKSDLSQSHDMLLLLRRDAGILIQSMGRLSLALQLKLLSRLIRVINFGVTQICIDDEVKLKFRIHRRSTTFLARLITVTATLIDIVSVGDNVCTHLVGSSHYPLPPRIEAFDASDEFDPHPWGISYCEDETLDDLFDLSPYLSRYKIDVLPESERSMHRHTLEMLIELGLEAARYDGCHLVFSVWNACARSDVWYTQRWTGVSSDHFFSSGNGLKLIQLRQDLCFIFNEIRRVSATNGSTTFYGRMYEQGRNSQVDIAQVIIDGVAVMIDVISHCVEEKSSKITPGDFSTEIDKRSYWTVISKHDEKHPTGTECCVLETIYSFITFLVSCFTIPEFRYLSHDDASASDSDDEKLSRDDDSCIEARIKLHDDCEFLGISPFHPDMLDVSCKLRTGISRSVTAKQMKDLIEPLLRSGRWALNNMIQSLEYAIPKSADVDRITLIPAFHAKSASDRCHVFKDFIREIRKGYTEDLVECITNDLPTRGIEDAARQEFVRNSSTLWIRGRLYDFVDYDDLWTFSIAELRTNAEWEMLMAEGLLGASCIVDIEADENLSDLFLCPIRWKRILVSVMNTLVTAVGLLRFCLKSGGDGESPHSDLFIDCDTLEGDKIDKHTIFDILAFMSDVATSPLDSSVKRMAKTIATTLMASSSDFSTITSILSATKLLRDINTAYVSFANSEISPSKAAQLMDILVADIDSIPADQLISSLCYDKASVFLINKESVNVSALFPHLAKFSTAFDGDWNDSTFLRVLITPCFSLSVLNHSIISFASQLKVLSFLEKGIKAVMGNSSKCFGFIESLSHLWSQVDDKQCVLISEQLLSEPADIGVEAQSVGRKRCFVIGCIISSSDVANLSGPSLTIYRLILSSMNVWARRKGFDHIIYLLCIISLRYNVSDLLEHLIREDDLDDNKFYRLYYLHLYFDFLEGLEIVLGLNLPFKSRDISFDHWGFKPLTKVEMLERRCTFEQTGEEFAAQHWYNCYTCGLTFERGCCNVCALVCHAGHDVGYSKFSSFFCDCGGETSKSLNALKKSSPCLCLKSSSTAKRILDDSIAKIYYGTRPDYERQQIMKSLDDDEDLLGGDFYYIAANIKTEILSKNLHGIIEEVIRIQLTSKLMKECSRLATSVASRSALESKYDDGFFPNPKYDSVYRTRYDNLNMRLRVDMNMIGPENVVGSVTSLVNVEPFQKPLKATSISLSSVKYTAGRNNSSAKAIGKSNSSRRSLIACDNHARLYIAEPFRVNFCSALTLINTIGHSSDSAIERSIVGGHKVEFMIVGLKISQENDRHMLVYGVSDAMVFVMNEHGNQVEAKIDLMHGRRHLNDTKSDNDFIVHSEWCPGFSGAILLIYLSKKVFVYDLRRSAGVTNATENSFYCEPAACYSATQVDMIIVSGVLIPISYDENGYEGIESSDKLKQYLVVCLVQSGHLQCVQMTLSSKGEIRDQGGLFVEFDTEIQVPSPASGTSYHITYLAQSSILVYVCSSAPALALVLNQSGKVSGKFELLPNTVSSEFDITGPLLDWKELGIVEREMNWFYRALCIGKCSSSKQDIVLYVEFNRYTTTVNNLRLTGSSFEGSTVCSVEMYNHLKNERRDSIIFSALRSDGCLFMLEESTLSDSSAAMVACPIFSHTRNIIYRTKSIGAGMIFESLFCVSNNEDCVVSCNSGFTENNEKSKKLMIGNRVFFYSITKPSNNFTIALKGRNCAREICKEEYAIVALRVLTGSCSKDSIPENISVCGKLMQLPKSMKRYHDFILTEQDIINGVRNGFITISIPSSVDSGNTFIDGVEIYAVKRHGVTFLSTEVSWVGWDFTRNCSNSMLDPSVADEFTCLERAISSVIVTSKLLKSHGYQITMFPEDVVSHLVQLAFIEPRDQLALVMKELFTEQNSYWYDEVNIQSITDYVIKVSYYSNTTEYKDLKLWCRTCLIKKCINLALDIISYRPSNYITSAVKFFPAKINTSLARVIKDMLDATQSGGCASIYQSLLMLGLNEAALVTEQNSSTLPIDASSSLEVVYELLRYHGRETVALVKPFLEERKCDWLDAQTEAAYCCDACDTFPIKIIRYTHTDMTDIDICALCYEVSYSYSKLKHFSCDVPAIFMNGRQLEINGRPINCSEIPAMKPIPVSQVTIGPPVEAKAIGEQAKSKINFNAGEMVSPPPIEGKNKDKKDLHDVLLGIVLKATMEVLSADGLHGTESGDIKSLFDLLLFLIEHTDQKDEKFLKESIYRPVIERMSQLCLSIPWQQSLLMRCFVFLQNLITTMSRSKIVSVGQRSPWTENGSSVTSDQHLTVTVPKEKLVSNISQGIWLLIASNIELRAKLRSALSTKLERSLEIDSSAMDILVHDEKSSEPDRTFYTSTKVLNYDHGDGSLRNVALLGTRASFQQALASNFGSLLDGCRRDANNFVFVDSLLSFMCTLGTLDHQNALLLLDLNCWRSPLCELIVTRSVYMEKASQALKALCQVTNNSYANVIDHYNFEIGFTRLIQTCRSLFTAAFEVREKAQQIHHHRIDDQQKPHDDLNFSSFIGVSDLISEDSYRVDETDKIAIALQHLVDSVTSSQINCWSAFCLSPSTETFGNSCPMILEPRKYSINRPPLCSLVWLGCILTGPNRIKAFKLAQAAMPTSIQGFRSESEQDSYNGKMRNIHLSVESVYSFVTEFAFARDLELRDITTNISQSLILSLDEANISALIVHLSHLLLREIGCRGCDSIEFIKLIQNITNGARGLRTSDVRLLAQVIMSSYLTQIQLPCHGYDKTRSSNDTDVERLCCWSCSQSKTFLNNLLSTVSNKLNVSNRNPSLNTMGASNTSTFLDTTKYRLDSITDRSSFTAFASYVQLKVRIELHELSITVSDPRGKYLKKIEVYFSSRPVESSSDLKSPSYNCWQLCGTLLLSKGGSSARTVLEIPVTAGNLKIEYKEFYERNDSHSSRKSDGNSTLQCPRCSTLITNSHSGVCNLCGEAAFQCRRCRHINYERLDALLCVECGYCANGSFSFEVKGVLASKAVAILDDEDARRSVRQLQYSRRTVSSTRSMLIQKLGDFVSDTKNGNGDDFSDLDLYGKQLSNALLGKRPSINYGTSESFERRKSHTFLDVSERVRSLLTLAHPTISNRDSSTRVELLFQQALLNSRLLSDTIEPSDSFSADLHASRHMEMEHDNPVHASDRSIHDFTSDLFTRILRRVNERETSSAITLGVVDDAVVAEAKKRSASQASPEEDVEEIKKLLHLHREAASDCYDINHKLAAWTKLNKYGLLGSHWSDIKPLAKFTYIPSSCSNCSTVLSYHLLLVLKTLLVERYADAQCAIGSNFISSLFDFTDDRHKELSQLKRFLIVTLATESFEGSNIILDILKRRLSTRDIECAGILGKIVAKSSSEAFVRLALDTLDML